MGSFLKKVIDHTPVIGPTVVAGNEIIHGNVPSFNQLQNINPVSDAIRAAFMHTGHQSPLDFSDFLRQLNPVAYLQGVPEGLKAASTAQVETVPRDNLGVNANVDRSIKNAIHLTDFQKETQHPTDRGGTGASPTGEPGPERSDSHSTAWDTDPMYAVVSRLTKKDYDTMFKGMKDATTVTNKATSVVLQKLAEAGYKIDPDAAKVFQDGAEKTMTEWYRANKTANGHPPSMTEYFEALTRAALLSRGQTPGDTATTTGTTADGTNGLGDTTNFVGAADRAAADPNQSRTTSLSGGLTQEQQKTPELTDFGTHQYEKTDDAKKAAITLDSPEAQPGGGVWMSGKGGWLDDPTVYNAYLGFLLGADQYKNPDGTPVLIDRSVDAFNKYMNVDQSYKLWEEQQRKGGG